MWASRIEGGSSFIVPWPTLDAVQIQGELVLLQDRWLQLVSGIATVRYANAKGEACSNRFDDIVLEVLLHGAHHRCQVALALRLKGFALSGQQTTSPLSAGVRSETPLIADLPAVNPSAECLETGEMAELAELATLNTRNSPHLDEGNALLAASARK